MPRRRCCGRIDETIVSQTFLPQGFSRWPEVTVQFEELEAIRLKDILGLDQTECAASMGFSRATFQRILGAAREKIATALVEGRPIIIQGGHYTVKKRIFECLDCRQQWEEEPCSAGGKPGYELTCPECGSLRKKRFDTGSKHPCSEGNNSDK